jgi:hypothetical protein
MKENDVGVSINNLFVLNSLFKEIIDLDDILEIGIALGIYKHTIDSLINSSYYEGDDCDDAALTTWLDMCIALWKQYYDVVNKHITGGL